jgi:hypothetical protein
MSEMITSAHVDTFERLAPLPLDDEDGDYHEETAEWETLPALLRGMAPDGEGVLVSTYREDIARIAACLRSVLADAAQTAQGERAADREVERLTALVDSLRATIAEHERVRDEVQGRLFAAEERAVAAERAVHAQHEVIEAGQAGDLERIAMVEHLRGREMALLTRSDEMIAEVTAANKRTSDAIEEQNRAINEGNAHARHAAELQRHLDLLRAQADARPAESEVEAMAREFAATGWEADWRAWGDAFVCGRRPLTAAEARAKAEDVLADRDARRKAGGAA